MMPREVRTCSVTGRSVVLNEGWRQGTTERVSPPASCWLCEYSGPVIAEERGWRALPHPIPALGIEGDPRPIREGEGVRMQAVGAHELLAGAHEGEDFRAVLTLAQRRIKDLRRDSRLRGFRLARRHLQGHHPVWQLFAFPFELAHSAPAPWRDGERQRGRLLLDQSPSAVALLAWAPRVPFETWFLPRTGRQGMEEGVVDGVAAMAGEWWPRLLKALGEPPVDLVVEDGQPWRLEVLPRLGTPTLLEQAAGMPVHGVFPEAARDFLRSAG